MDLGSSTNDSPACKPYMQAQKSRTAGEAGWHVSRYNLVAALPSSDDMVIANLFEGTCASYSLIEQYLLSTLEELDEHHPIISLFARRGVIANFDEQAALLAMQRASCADTHGIGLTICPTMRCNFDCPYCFEDHARTSMSPKVQDDVVALVARMLAASNMRNVTVCWFGGEPLLALDVIESLSSRIIALVHEHGGRYRASIYTNGYLLAQDAVDTLARCGVNSCQVTIDGMGATHDATRHLVGGGPTFERIVSNLRSARFPFRVHIRHNVHENNRSDMVALKTFIQDIAEESGNDLVYYPAPVNASDVADRRGCQVCLLCDSATSDVSMLMEAGRFGGARGRYCGAQALWCVCIDDAGNLYKCWETVDKKDLSFGNARDWDPARPFVTASRPDVLTGYLNTTGAELDGECQDCVWLPFCVGGCPHRRLYESRACLPFKDEPERFVLTLYRRLEAIRRSA